MAACELASQRPQDFSWVTIPVSGEVINITAVDWNSFTERINSFRNYKGLSVITFTAASSGQIMQAIQANEAVNAISDMNPSVSPPSLPVSGNTAITALFFNGVVASLNSIT